MTSLYDFSARAIDGRQTPLSEFRGKVVLIVNVASECGFTPQYAGLQALHARFADRGFTVLGFPCNQFGGQEPGEEGAICSFAQTRYGVTFPLFAKIEVNGPHADPLWVWLKKVRPGLLGSQAIKWNFTKFLVDSEGKPVARFAPSQTPQSLERAVEKLLPN